MKRMLFLVIACAVVFSTVGCVQELDVKAVAARQCKYDSDQQFATMMRQSVVAFKEVCDKKHALQEQIIRDNWVGFLKANGAVMDAETGKITGKIELAVLLPSLEQWKKDMDALEGSRKSVDVAVDKTLTAIDLYEKSNIVQLGTELDIMQAKQSAQAAANAALTALSGLASGIGGALLIAG